MRLIQFALRQSLVLNLLTLMIIGFGLIKAADMRREAFPSIALDYLTIRTIYPGASPWEVEKYVTDPIEEKIEGIVGIEKLKSVSIEAMSLITVELDPDRTEREKDRTINDIQRAVGRADLPAGLPDPPEVQQFISGRLPFLEISLTGEGMDYRQLKLYADELVDQIESLPDVADVDYRNEREREFWVVVDPDKMAAYDVGLGFIMTRIAQQNINLPGGAYQTAHGEVLIRTIGEAVGVEELGRIVLFSNDAGIEVQLRDVAEIVDTFEKSSLIVRTNGIDAIMLGVSINTERGDIIRVVDEVRKLTDDFLTAINDQRLKVDFINDMSVFVKNRLGVLLNNGVGGLLLVLLVLVVFLSKGIAFVTAIGMPIAFLGALLVMSFSGVTINLITMFAMVMVVGMLVDDAIIVAENIWQHYEAGASPREATIRGAGEVIWPVTATILTTIAAFSPMLMVSGIFGKFIQWLPITVIIMLVVSLIEALIILPPHAYDVLKLSDRLRRGRGGRSDERPQTGRLRALSLRGYEATLRLTLRLRYAFMAGVIALSVFTGWYAYTRMQLILFPTEGVDAFFVRGQLPLGSSLQEAAEAFSELERAIVAGIPADELKDYVTYVGLIQQDQGDPFTERGSHLGQIAVYLTPYNDRERDAADVIEAIRTSVQTAGTTAGFTEIWFDQVRTGPPVGKPISVNIQGHDFSMLQAVAAKIATAVAAIPHTRDVAVDNVVGKDEIRIEIDRREAARYLLDADQISQHVLAAFEGTIASYIRETGERVPIRVRLTDQSGGDLEVLKHLQIENAQGHLVPLQAVASFRRGDGVQKIIHREARRNLSVKANIDEAKTSSREVNRALLPEVERLRRTHPDITIELGGEYEETTKSMESLAEAFAVAIALIFLILTAQFGSVTQPLVVMAAIPFGTVGAVWSYWAHGMPISFVGLIGLIGLTGVVVNDSIVMVDFINKARARGMAVFDAAIDAARKRLRAVWLTTATTVMGMLPMVYGIGGTDLFVQPAAVSLGYGLLFGTVLVLYFVPALYVIRDDIARLLRWALRMDKWLPE